MPPIDLCRGGNVDLVQRNSLEVLSVQVGQGRGIHHVILHFQRGPMVLEHDGE